MRLIAGDVSNNLKLASDNYNSCLASLPTKVRRALVTTSSRGRGRKWSRLTQNKVEKCLALQRDLNDAKNIILLKEDLIGLYENCSTPALRYFGTLRGYFAGSIDL